MGSSGCQVLVVEDEALLALDLAVCLETMGHDVVVATTGLEAIESAYRLRPDIVLMDIRLKGSMDGIEASISIRSQIDIPVIFLTAHSDHETVERASAVRPAGYIVKPFNAAGLRASIQLALGRARHEAEDPGAQPASSQITRLTPPPKLPWKREIVVGNLRIDPVLHRVFCGERQINLTKKEFLILQHLAEHPGTPFSPQDLLSKLWGPGYSHYAKSVRNYLGNLRRKIDRASGAGISIETIRGVGYRLLEQDPKAR